MMRFAVALLALTLVAGGAFASAPMVTLGPGGDFPPPGPGEPIVCDVKIQYDDGTDDTPGSGWTLGNFGNCDGQSLGVIFTPSEPGLALQSVEFYSEFWVWPGDLDINIDGGAYMFTVFIAGGNDVTYAFDLPDLYHVQGDFCVKLNPHDNVWGVAGEDYSAPDGRSYWSGDACAPTCDNQFTDNDLMIRACVSTSPSPNEATSWSSIKALYE